MHPLHAYKEKKKVSYLDEITIHTYDAGDVFEVLDHAEGLGEEIKLDTDDSVEYGIFMEHEDVNLPKNRGFTEFGNSSTFTEDTEKRRSTFTRDKKANPEDVVMSIDDQREKVFMDVDTGRSNVFTDNMEHLNSNKIATVQLKNMFTGERIHVVANTKENDILDNEEIKRKQRAQYAKERLKLKSRKRTSTDDICLGMNKEDKEIDKKD